MMLNLFGNTIVNYSDKLLALAHSKHWKCIIQAWDLLDQLLGFEETLEMSHLPGPHHEEDASLRQRPPQHSLIGGLAGLSKPLLSVPLIVLLLRDLLNLENSIETEL